MEVTDNRIKKIQSIKAVTTALLLLVGLTSVFPLTAIAAAPTASGAILRVVLTSDATNSYATPVDVSRYFSDADGDTLSYTAVSGDTGVATVSVSGSKVTITRVAAGRTTVAVTASDGSLTARQIIDVRVHPVNSSPMAIGTVSSIMLPAGGDAATIDTLSYIIRPDEVALTIMQTGDKSIITSSLLGAKVTITPKAKGATRVRFGNAYNDHTINVKVLPANRAPAAQGTISPVTLYLGGSAQTVDFSSKLSDPDDNPLVYSAVSSAPGVATVSLSGTVVKITQVKVGTSTVTVTARDGKLSGTQTIAVTVPNRAPVAVGTISPVTATLGGGAIDVDVSSKFSDPDLHTLSYTTVSSDTTKATASVSGSTVKITAVAVGTVTVTVTANDGNGGTGTQTIGVTVPNRAPTAVGTISPVTLTAGGSATDVDVSSKFGDPDNHTLTYTAVSSDTSKATVSVSGAVVKITPRASGTATVTVTANDNNGGSVKQTISVRVSNRAPIKVGTISPVTLTAAGSSTNVDVSGKFLDPDSDTLSYTAVSSDTTKATVSVSSSTVTITPVAAGSATVTVTASDGSLTATQTISVTVEQSNRAPTAVGTISPVTLTTAGSSANVNVSSKFSDPNGDTLSYTAVSSDTTKATVSVSSAVVTITPKAVGTSTVTVTASDGSLTATQTIAVTVRQSNRAPTAVGTISPVTLTAGGISTNRNVSSKFSDPDNDTLGYTAVSSNTTKATVSVSGAVVTITPKTAGTATVTVTASDGSLTATQTISVTVNPPPNGAPTTVGTILPITLTAGGSATNVGVSTYFSDPDGDTLTYTAVSSDTTKATVSVSSSTVTITPKAVGSATVTVTARDNGSLTATQTIAVTVSTTPNRAPERVGTIDPVILTAGASPANVNVSSKFRDPDNDTLSYTAVSSDTTKATVSVSSSTVAITPKAVGSATVTVTARDTNGLTATQIIAVLVTAAPNRAPVAVGTIPPVTPTAGASPTSVNVLSNFSDPDGDTLNYTAVSSNTGVATVSVLGATVAITPKVVGTTTVTVTARDNNGLTATQTIVVLVTAAPNRAPVAVGAIPPVTLTTGASAINVDLSSNFSDPDSDPLTYTAVSSDTTKATVNVSGNIVVISPVGEGSATVTATARDNNGLTAQQTIVVLVNQGTVVVREPPPSNGVSGTVGGVASITLTAGDSAQMVNLSTYFSEGGALSYTAVSTDTSKATVSVAGTIATITPVAEGTTTIMVTASNSEGLTTTQTIVVLVTAVPNRAPVASGTIVPVTLTAGDSAQMVNLSTYFSDPDSDTLSYTAVSANTRVATIAMSNSIITITPVAEGTATVQVTASDGSLNATQTIVVLVNPPPNRAPMASGTIVPVTLTAGDSPTNLDVSSYFSDPDGDRLTYTAVSSDTSRITVSMSGAIITITPVAEGTTTITVMAQDLEGLTIIQTIAVTVNPPPNRAPMASGTIVPVTLTAGDSPTNLDVSSYFSDPDGDRLTYTAVSSDTSRITVSMSGAIITITPVAEGTATIMVIAQDSEGLTIIQAIAVTVNPAPNRAPVTVGTIAPVTLTAGANPTDVDVSIYFSDLDGDRLSYTAVSADTRVATVSVSNTTVTIDSMAEGTTTVTVTVSDGSLTTTQTIAVLVIQPNRAPVAVGTLAPITLTTRDSAQTVNLSTYFSDLDGDALSYTAVSADTAKATVSVSDAVITITPMAVGTTTIMVIAQDSEGLTATQTIVILVTAAPNSAPMASRTIPPITLTAGDRPTNTDISIYFSDLDGDVLSYAAVSADTSKATVSVSGALATITPVAEGTTTIMVMARDSEGLTITQTVSVLVNPAPNRAPAASGTIAPVTLTVDDSAKTVDLSIYFSDLDGDALSYTAVSADTAKATVSVSNTTLTITPVAEGTTTVTVTVSDSSLNITQTLSVIVIQPNRAPVVGTIDPITLTAGDSAKTVELSTYFSDPDSDRLSYTAVSADTRVATASVSNATLTISPVAAGGTMVMVIVQDTDGLTITRAIAVTVNPAPNRAPAPMGTIVPITLTAGDSTQTVDVSTYFSDPDGDRLGYTAVSANTGVATVTVSDATITITPVAEGATTVTATANDGSLNATQTIPILVNSAPNRAPMVEAPIAPVTLVAGAGPTDMDVSVYFSDPDGDKLSYIAVSADTDVATVSLSDTTLTITPVADGATTVTITASDSSLNATQTIAVLVIQPNRVPVVVETIEPVTLTAGDSALTLDVADKFLDPAGDVLTYSVQSADTTVVTVGVANSTIIITPVAEGATTVIVTAQDSEGLTAFQTIAITVTSTPNRAPVPVGMINPITLTVGDSSATVNIADKFADPDGNRLTYNAISSDTGVATVAVASATLTITPVNEGTATVMLIVKDTHGLTATRNFTVMVNSAPNRAPVVLRTVDPVTLTSGNSAAATDIADRFSDPDGDRLTYTAVSANTAVVTASMTNSTLTITPVAAGTTTVMLTASDGSLNITQTIAVTVNPALNRAPVAVGTVNPVTLTAGDSSTTMNMADKFSDPDGDRLTYTVVSANAAVVTVSMTNSTLTITPVAAGTTTVMVVVQDTDGLTTTRNVTVTVLLVPNRAPVAVGTIDPITLVLEDDAQAVDLSTHFSDPDGDPLTYTAASSDATKATVSVSNSTLTITPVAAGTTTVMVIVQDTDGLTVTQTIAVTVNPPPNRAPVAVGIIDPIILMLGDDDQTVDLSSLFSDPDGDDLTYSAQSADTTIATVAVENATLTLTPVVEGTTTVMITVQDTEGLTVIQNIAVTVNSALNTVPILTSATAFSVMENITTVGTVTAVDTNDEDTITGYTITGGTDSAKFSIDPLSGELHFNTAPDFENPDDTSGINQYTVVVQVVSGTDDRALTAEQTITVTVTDGNDAPVAVGTIDPITLTIGVEEQPVALTVGDGEQTVDVSDKFSDPDGDDLTYSAQSADTTVAQVTVEDSIVTITPVEEGTTTITVTALDAASLTATQPITVTVVVAKAVNAAGSLIRLNATISAVLSSTGLTKANPGRPVANGDTLVLSVNIGLEGLEVTADISALDSTQSLISLTPDRHGRYTAEISISEDNTALNGLKHILVVAKDAFGNSTQLIVTSTLNNRYVTELLPNYPNPFNPETWIPYRLGKDAEVTLTIYDARGDVVRRFDLGYQPAGAYETRSRAVYWNGTNDFGETVANGVYFYSLSTNDYSRTRKAIILK